MVAFVVGVVFELVWKMMMVSCLYVHLSTFPPSLLLPNPRNKPPSLEHNDAVISLDMLDLQETRR